MSLLLPDSGDLQKIGLALVDRAAVNLANVIVPALRESLDGLEVTVTVTIKRKPV